MKEGIKQVKKEDVVGLKKQSKESIDATLNTANKSIRNSFLEVKEQELGLPNKEALERVKGLIAHIEKEEALRLFSDNGSFVSIANFPLRVRDYESSSGQFIPVQDKLIVESQEFGDIDFFLTLLHENIHRLSRVNFHHKQFGGIDGKGNIEQRRVGFHEGSSLIAFNEGITEYYTLYLLVRYGDKIREIYGEQIYKKVASPYLELTKLMEFFIKAIAKEKNISSEEVQNMFFRAIFTGEKMWMRIFDKIYGAGSQIVISRLNLNTNFTNIISDYFNEVDISKKIKKGLEIVTARISNESDLGLVLLYMRKITKAYGHEAEKSCKEEVRKMISETEAILELHPNDTRYTEDIRRLRATFSKFLD